MRAEADRLVQEYAADKQKKVGEDIDRKLDEINKACDANIIASGGVHTIEDIRICKNLGLYGTICGKSIYSGTLDLNQALKEAE